MRVNATNVMMHPPRPRLESNFARQFATDWVMGSSWENQTNHLNVTDYCGEGLERMGVILINIS